MKMTKLALVAALLLLVCTALADIKTLSLDTDPGDTILLHEFGFSDAGHVNISVDRIVVQKAQEAVLDPSRLGFVLVANIYDVSNDSFHCMLDSNYSICVLRFPALSPAFSLSCRVTFPGDYRLSFANCAPLYTSVAVTVRTELYNLEPGGNRDYLSSTITYLPSMLVGFAAVNISLLGFWIVFCFFNRTYVRWLHLLFSVLLLVKALSLACAAADWHDLRSSGMPRTWHLYVSRSVNLVLLFAVLVIIEGRLFLKKFSRTRENATLLIVISLQVLANVLLMVNGEHVPLTSYVIRGLCLVGTGLFDVISSLVILCVCCRPPPANYTANATENTSREDTDRIRKFSHFGIVVLLYLALRILVYGLNFRSPYELVFYNTVEDVSSLAFFMACLYIFMPSKSNEYLYTNAGNIPRVTGT